MALRGDAQGLLDGINIGDHSLQDVPSLDCDFDKAANEGGCHPGSTERKWWDAGKRLVRPGCVPLCRRKLMTSAKQAIQTEIAIVSVVREINKKMLDS